MFSQNIEYEKVSQIYRTTSSDQQLGGGGGVLNKRCRLTNVGITVLKIRRSRDCLIFNMGIPYLGKTVFILRRGPASLRVDNMEGYGAMYDFSLSWKTLLVWVIIWTSMTKKGTVINSTLRKNISCDKIYVD